MRGIRLLLLALALAVWQAPAAMAERCTASPEIETDRPDVTNSSLVVPFGSLQNENGIDFASARSAQTLTGTNSRLRLGVADCLEVLVDLPAYTALLGGSADWGLSNVTPGIKWQISPLPGKVDLSAVAGIGLPVGASIISGPGVQPYLQAPWSVEITEHWSLTGMVTAFFRPSTPEELVATQYTFAIDREVGENGFLFTEFVADRSPSLDSRMINSGAGYKITPTKQIDFHVAVGISPDAPAFIVGIGYSMRFDRLFGAPR